MKENEVLEPTVTVKNGKALVTVPVGLSVNLRELLKDYEMTVLAYVEEIDLGATQGKLTCLSKYARSGCSFRHADTPPWKTGEFLFNATLPLDSGPADKPVPVTVSAKINFDDGCLIVGKALVDNKIPETVTFLWGVNPKVK